MREQYLSVDSFLEELQSEGQKDSTGAFTLTLAHARQKLAEHQLENPREYLLKLIQAGVAAGAREMELLSHTTWVRFTMHGVSFHPLDLQEILNHLLHSRPGAEGRALRHLATAVNTAILTRASGLRLGTFDGERGEQLHWRADGRTRRPWRPRRGGAQVSFELRRTAPETLFTFYHLFSQRDILSMLIGSRDGMDPDRRLVMDRAGWCPVPLKLNGRWLPRPSFGPPEGQGLTEKSLVLPRQNGDPGIRSFLPSSRNWPWTRAYLSPVGAVLGSGDQRLWKHVRSQVRWVLDGIEVGNVPLEGIPLTRFGWAVLSAHECNTDLTGLRVRLDPFAERCAAPALSGLSEMLGEKILLAQPRSAARGPNQRIARGTARWRSPASPGQNVKEA